MAAKPKALKAGGGHRLGSSAVPADKWRCGVCSFMQSRDAQTCGTCGEPQPPPPPPKPAARAAAAAAPRAVRKPATGVASTASVAAAAKPKPAKPLKPKAAAAATAAPAAGSSVAARRPSAKELGYEPKAGGNVHRLRGSTLTQTTASYRAANAPAAAAASGGAGGGEKKIYTLSDTKLNGLNNPPIRHAPATAAAAANGKPKPKVKPKASAKPKRAAAAAAPAAVAAKGGITTIHDLPPAHLSAAAAPNGGGGGGGDAKSNKPAAAPTPQDRILGVISDLQAASNGDVMPSLRAANADKPKRAPVHVDLGGSGQTSKYAL